MYNFSCSTLKRVLDTKVQMYLRKVREGGGKVTGRIAIAAARGILETYDKNKLAENGGAHCSY